MIGSSKRVYWSCHSTVPGLLFSSTTGLSFLEGVGLEGGAPPALDSCTKGADAMPAVPFMKLRRPIRFLGFIRSASSGTVLLAEGEVLTPPKGAVKKY